jgi:hypothetical protein
LTQLERRPKNKREDDLKEEEKMEDDLKKMEEDLKKYIKMEDLKIK